jgi:hypothetical protein
MPLLPRFLLTAALLFSIAACSKTDEERAHPHRPSVFTEALQPHLVETLTTDITAFFATLASGDLEALRPFYDGAHLASQMELGMPFPQYVFESLFEFPEFEPIPYERFGETAMAQRLREMSEARIEEAHTIVENGTATTFLKGSVRYQDHTISIGLRVRTKAQESSGAQEPKRFVLAPAAVG